MISLGFWQLGRAHTKEQLRDQRTQNSAGPEVKLTAGMDDKSNMLMRSVRVEGELDLERQFILINQKYRGQPGMYVFAPVQLGADNAAVLVNRGWLPRPEGRAGQALPPLPGGAPDTIHGVVDSAPSVGIKLGEPAARGAGWPRTVTYLDLDWASRELGTALMPYVVLQQGGAGPFVRDWHLDPRDPQMPAEKHVSYAVQWFAMAAVLAAIFIGVNTRRIGGATEVEH